MRVARTVVVRSTPIPRRMFRMFVELEGMYRNAVEQLTMFAVRESITSFIKLKALKYREMRNLYPHLPSHYAYTACQDANTRAKSFLKLRKEKQVRREYPEVRRVSIWLDDHLWKSNNLTSVSIATHRGWITIELEPHKQFWKYVNRGWRLASEAKIKLDKRSRAILVYLTFVKEVEPYESRGGIPVDVNENNVTLLLDGIAYLFETSIEKVVLGYYYRRKRIQERYDKLYGVSSRVERRVLRKLKEHKKKQDIKWKIANIVVRGAHMRQYAVVLERLGKKPASNMIEKIRDDQLRHRIFQASFRGIQRAIEEKAREYGVPVIHVNPKNTSKTCPIHSAQIIYGNGSRVGRCSRGGELWHRDVAACWNLLLRALLGDGSAAPSLGRLKVDVTRVPFGSKAAHEPTVITRDLWARRKPLDETMNKHEMIGMNIQRQTEI